jgi:D-arabinose 1-dehydrogenase-like Zn-dependent alcohol dehydrogenase
MHCQEPVLTHPSHTPQPLTIMYSPAQTMRAVVVRDGKGDAGALFLGDAPRPAPGPGQALVKIRAFGLNRMDIMQRNGAYPGARSP